MEMFAKQLLFTTSHTRHVYKQVEGVACQHQAAMSRSI